MYCFSQLLSSPSLLRLPLVSPRPSIIIVHYIITTINFSLVSVEVSLHLEEEYLLIPIGNLRKYKIVQNTQNFVTDLTKFLADLFSVSVCYLKLHIRVATILVNDTRGKNII